MTFPHPLSSSTLLSHGLGGWEELRKQAKQIEYALDNQLASYGRLYYGNSSLAGFPPQPSASSDKDGTEALDRQIEALLERLQQCVGRMSELVAVDTRNPDHQHMSQHLQRHRDLLFDYTKEFNRAKALHLQNRASILPMSDKLTLDDSKRDEQGPTAEGHSVTDLLLSEQAKIDSSHRKADQVIEMAYTARESLYHQRPALYGSSSKLGALFHVIPAVQRLIRKIALRRRRDSLVLGLLIGLFLFIIVIYAFRRA